MIKKVVLAYSGGLDTSIIIPWLKEKYNCEVIAYAADVGQGAELAPLEEKAIATGASKIYIEDLREEFVRDYLWPYVKSSAVYEGKYLLGTSVARPLIAKRQIEIAWQEGADAVAHGCTGKGNDQVRFELTYNAMDPSIEVIAPWREWDIRSRDQAIDYAKARDIPLTATKKRSYSEDANLWHISHEGGVLENPSEEVPEDVYTLTTDPKDAPDVAEELVIEFEKGVPVAINGERLAYIELMEKFNSYGQAHGVGRVDLVENRLVGMKSRGAYETPGGTIIMEAHSALESICLDRDTLHLKQQLAIKYADLVYDGLWFGQCKQALDGFIDVTQEMVSGIVTVKLFKGRVWATKLSSPFSLYQESLATFDEDDDYDQADAAGFINLFGLSNKTQAARNRKQKIGK